MRNLTQEEVEVALDDNGEPEEGCVAIEATVQELADMGAGTACGTTGNQAFKVMAEKGYGHRKCRGWFLDKPLTRGIEDIKRQRLPASEEQARIANFSKCCTDAPLVMGMFHIKIQTDKTAEKVERVAGEAGGSLRFSGDSLWEGFKEFEIE